MYRDKNAKIGPKDRKSEQTMCSQISNSLGTGGTIFSYKAKENITWMMEELPN